MSTPPPAPALSLRKSFVVALVALTGVLALLWAFPTFWYTRVPAPGQFVWFAEQTNVAGWKFEDSPLAKTAEAFLAADRTFNGDFAGPAGTKVRAYAAKRYLKKENEIGLFSHTPDRCWTAVGWKIESAEPDYFEQTVHGVPIRFERRLFSNGGQRELVYFGALVGGKPLPYRIDQYLAASRKRNDVGKGDLSGTMSRLKETRLWGWAWESFLNRTPLAGPQQFIRISTPVTGNDLKPADDRLTRFLDAWLQPVEYNQELEGWKQSRK